MIIGSVIHGTMRNEDLIPTFLSELKERDTEKTYKKLIEEIQQNQKSTTYGDAGYYESEDATWDLEELFEALNELAPPFCYFGAHVGNGSDYGFWPDMEYIEQSREDGELIDVSPHNPERPMGFVSVNDHGNITVYGPDFEILLELV